MGDSRKYAYHTMDSFHSLTTPFRQNFQNVLSPDASGFPVQRPPRLASEFQKAVHGLVWIFSGIAQYIMLSLYHPPVIVSSCCIIAVEKVQTK